MEPSSPARPSPRLGWKAIALATVLAALAAAVVIVVLDGDDTSVDASAPGSSTPTLDLRPAEDVERGHPLDVTFTGSDGSETTLRESLDGPAVVNFFASWCAPCVAELPDMQEVAAEVDGRITFFGLAVTDRPEDSRAILARSGVTYDWGSDKRGDVSGAAGVFQMPTTMLVDADGEIVELHGGALDADELRDLIEEHLT